MEILFTITSFTLLIGLLVIPILLYNFIHKSGPKPRFALYMASAIIATVIIILFFSWWSYTSDMILLEHYGFNADGMNDAELYAKVSPENMDNVKSLQGGTMGIGWPLKAIIMFVFYSPYLLIMYFFSTLLAKRRLRKSIIT